MNIRRATTAALVTLGLLATTQVPAQADPRGPVASGAVGFGSASIAVPPVHYDLEELAPCRTGGVGTGRTPGSNLSGLWSFGPGESTCVVAPDGTARVTVTGRNFVFDALRAYDGPVIGLVNWTATCATTTHHGSNSNISLTALSGVSVPRDLPANHTVNLTSRTGAALGKVVFNELVVPSPPDGSMKVNLMHITMYPVGPVQFQSEVVVGAVRCAPLG